MTPSNLTIQSSTDSSGVLLLRMTGTIDGKSFHILEQAIKESFRSGQYRIVIDLSNVEYVSSTGLGVFLGTLPVAREHNGNIVLLNPTSKVRQLIVILNLVSVMQIADDMESARCMMGQDMSAAQISTPKSRAS